jgi:hypothetical protein
MQRPKFLWPFLFLFYFALKYTEFKARHAEICGVITYHQADGLLPIDVQVGQLPHQGGDLCPSQYQPTLGQSPSLGDDGEQGHRF